MAKLRLPREKTFTGPALIWKRIAAFLIDVAIITVFVLFPFGTLFKGIFSEGQSFSEALKAMSGVENTAYILAIYFSISFLAFMYFYLLESKMSQTIGKCLMKIYVISDRNELKRWQIVVRNLFLVPIFPFDLLVVADPLFMAFTNSNQRLTEILSKTRVVEKFSLGSNF